jgi:alpha-L-fucosidase
MILSPLQVAGTSTGNGWIDNDLRRIVDAIRELQGEVNYLGSELHELKEFVKYVDATAPELRTAYQVSKRIT